MLHRKVVGNCATIIDRVCFGTRVAPEYRQPAFVNSLWEERPPLRAYTLGCWLGLLRDCGASKPKEERITTQTYVGRQGRSLKQRPSFCILHEMAAWPISIMSTLLDIHVIFSPPSCEMIGASPLSLIIFIAL
jgi:hypothetical protein